MVGLVSADWSSPFTRAADGEFLERLTRDILTDVLDDVPLQLPEGMWFMHDGAPPHFSRIARQYLNDHFPGKWIGRNGPVAWPPRSPDLTQSYRFLPLGPR
jgi:hypothetical protein